MFGTIRRHQKWLWVFLATITIVSFVIYGPTNARLGNALGAGGTHDVIDGHEISQKDFQDAAREVVLEYYAQTGQWPRENSPQIRLQTWLHLLLIQKQKEYGIQVSTEAAAQLAKIMLGGDNGISFDVFVNERLKKGGLNADDFDRFLRHEIGKQQLSEMVTLPGRLVTPQEAETLYRKDNQETAASMISFPASNYLAAVPVTPDELTQFYSNRVSVYRIPDRVQVEYVEFDVTNYLAAAESSLTNLAKIIENEYQAEFERYGTNMFGTAKTPDERKARIKEGVIREVAMGSANKAASVFSDQLDKTKNHTPAGFEEFARTNGLTLRTSAPFDRANGPADLKVSDSFAQNAFAVTAEEPFAGPIRGDDGIYVIALKQYYPTEVPAFKDIEGKVTADYREQQALQLSLQAATKLNAMLTNGLAQGKKIEALLAEAKAKLEPLPPIARTTRNLPPKLEAEIDLNNLQRAVLFTPAGSANILRGRSGTYIIYVEKQLPVDEVKLTAELPGFVDLLRRGRANELFQRWIGSQFQQQDPALFKKVQDANMEAQQEAARSKAR